MNKINKLLAIYALFIVAAAGSAYLTLPDADDSKARPARTNRRESVYDASRRPVKEYVDAKGEHAPRAGKSVNDSESCENTR